jgi:hypothetical protein
MYLLIDNGGVMTEMPIQVAVAQVELTIQLLLQERDSMAVMADLV